MSSPQTSAEYRKCQRRYGYRRFWKKAERARHLPPLLWTFPGAGNTWVRMLLDYSTGIYSGSIYGDPSLLPLLPGEGRCDRSVIAIKAHPTHIDSNDFISGRQDYSMMRLNTTRKPQYAKCAPLRFGSVIVVTRDPFRAIWAEYKRYVNWKEVIAGRPSGNRSSPECRLALRSQSLHSGALLRACFEEAHFHRHAYHLARQWKHTWYHYAHFQKLPGARMLQVAYEDLASPDRRHSVLRSMVDFLNLQPRVGDEALGCAFSLADNPHIHRQHTAAAARDTSRVNIEDAYANTTGIETKKSAALQPHGAALASTV